MTDWPMFWITFVYVIATIAICYFNYCSAKASRDQLEEMKRQQKENNRPIIVIEVVYINRAFLGFRLTNEGNRIANDVSVDLSDDFIQSIEEHTFKTLLINQKSKKCIIGVRNIAVGATMPSINTKLMGKIPIAIPDMETQINIASILDSIDSKIELNEVINENLLEQVQVLYREMFINTTNDQRHVCRAEEYFEIAIGKTPPRKEHQWFTTNPSDVTWVSISDMGSCGTFISRSSEQLTQEAVNKFNIRVIPSNTVLLSFKLTVGRIAITHGEMTTNEAIAHFKTDKSYINEYLYCYLKDFNFQTMGSTSSIATAVNSKIIKSMPFVIPADDEISRFHSLSGPMFEQILNNQLENDSLAALRDGLLPKLMSGDLDVSNIDI